jgi:hypothetical protein
MVRHEILLNPQPGKLSFYVRVNRSLEKLPLTSLKSKGLPLYPSLHPTNTVTLWLTRVTESPDPVLLGNNALRDGRWVPPLQVDCCVHHQGINVCRLRQQFPFQLQRLHHVTNTAISVFTDARTSNVTKHYTI